MLSDSLVCFFGPTLSQAVSRCPATAWHRKRSPACPRCSTTGTSNSVQNRPPKFDIVMIVVGFPKINVQRCAYPQFYSFWRQQIKNPSALPIHPPSVWCDFTLINFLSKMDFYGMNFLDPDFFLHDCFMLDRIWINFESGKSLVIFARKFRLPSSFPKDFGEGKSSWGGGRVQPRTNFRQHALHDIQTCDKIYSFLRISFLLEW